jgi:hypothetical protein
VTSKYTQSELTEMAQLAIKARDDGDERYYQLVWQLAFSQDIPVHVVEARIEAMARGEFPANFYEEATA